VVLRKINSIVPTLEKLEKAVADDPVLHARTEGVGVLSKEAAIDYGALGPTARASGVARDIRKNCPYGAYEKIEWDMIVTQNGDVFDKVRVRIKEIFESIKIMKACFSQLPPGEIDCLIKDIPPGEGIGHIEAPRGECFHYVRSDGTNRPVRHKIRAPTYMNLPTFKATVVGGTISDAAIILAAIDPCYCCTERMAVINRQGQKLFTGDDLLTLSRKKTEQLKTKMGR
jgi:Ni,Fe-hydrogenase III large subunit